MYRPQRRDAARSPRRAGALPVFERQKPLRSHFIRRGGYALPDLHRPPALPQLFFSERTEIGVGLCCEEAARLILTRPEKTTLVVTGEGSSTKRRRRCSRCATIFSPSHRTARNRSISGWNKFYRPAVHTCRTSRLRSGQNFISRSSAWTRRGQAFLEALREHADELPLDDFAAHMKGRETEYEQLLIYFLYRHVLTALDDGDVSSKAAFAVLSVRLLFLAWCAAPFAARRVHGGGSDRALPIVQRGSRVFRR